MCPLPVLWDTRRFGRKRDASWRKVVINPTRQRGPMNRPNILLIIDG
jgi:hypothetical protein